MSTRHHSKTAWNRWKLLSLICAAAMTLSANSIASAQLKSPGQLQPPPQPQPRSPQPPPPQQPPGPPQPPPPAPPQPRFGDPLPNLTGSQMTAWNNGKSEFQDVETPASGLGPIFNNNSCAKCHSVPAIGGSSDILVTRFGHATGSTFDPLTSLGGSLLQDMAINPAAMENIPPQANITAHRQSTPLFGLGLIEAIPDSTILAGVRTTAVDGIKGRAAMVVDVASGATRVGRFGWKAQQATLLAFSGDAYVNEIGITNRLFPTENAPNGNQSLLRQFDKVPDPEDTVDPATRKAGIDRLADFMQLTAPPPPLPINASITFGAKIFADIGCTTCHTPMMTTGSSSVAALNAQRVMLFSDLLLHDMGSLGDGIAQGAAGVKEMKTAPLWGLRSSAPYLHDGRAPDIDSAIKAHDGEAAGTKNRYLQLSPDQKQLLAQFLNSI